MKANESACTNLNSCSFLLPAPLLASPISVNGTSIRLIGAKTSGVNFVSFFSHFNPSRNPMGLALSDLQTPNTCLPLYCYSLVQVSLCGLSPELIVMVTLLVSRSCPCLPKDHSHHSNQRASSKVRSHRSSEQNPPMVPSHLPLSHPLTPLQPFWSPCCSSNMPGRCLPQDSLFSLSRKLFSLTFVKSQMPLSH